MTRQEEDYEVCVEESETRQCDSSCSHYDGVNGCCWQATEKGLCFNVEEGEYCRLGYKEDGWE